MDILEILGYLVLILAVIIYCLAAAWRWVFAFAWLGFWLAVFWPLAILFFFLVDWSWVIHGDAVQYRRNAAYERRERDRQRELTRLDREQQARDDAAGRVYRT